MVYWIGKRIRNTTTCHNMTVRGGRGEVCRSPYRLGWASCRVALTLELFSARWEGRYCFIKSVLTLFRDRLTLRHDEWCNSCYTEYVGGGYE